MQSERGLAPNKIFSLGHDFSLSEFLYIMALKGSLEQGFPDCEDVDTVKVTADGFYSYFREFDKNLQTSERSLGSLDGFDSCLKKFYRSLDGTLFNQALIRDNPLFFTLVTAANMVVEEYIDLIGTYLIDLSVNPFPIQDFRFEKLIKEWQWGIVPQGVLEDWNEALACLNVQQYTAGCMMAYRATEAMLKYFYENITGEKPVVRKSNNGDMTPGIDDEMTWGAMVNKLTREGHLEDEKIDDLTNSLDRARNRRNDFAHGTVAKQTLSWEVARDFIESASDVILHCMRRLINRKRAWRVLFASPSFECAVMYVLIDYFAGGIVQDYKFCTEHLQPNQWPFYYIDPDTNPPQQVFEALVIGGRITNPHDRGGVKRLLAHIHDPAHYEKETLNHRIKDAYKGHPDGFDHFIFLKYIETARIILKINRNLLSNDLPYFFDRLTV